MSNSYKIKRTTVTIELEELKLELKSLSKRFKNQFPDKYGLFRHVLKTDMGLSLTELEFMELGERIGVRAHQTNRGKNLLYFRYEDLEQI